MSYYPYGSLLSGILLGGSLMFLLGLVDDIYNLDAKFKLFLQISIATLVYLLGVQINNIPFIGNIGISTHINFTGNLSKKIYRTKRELNYDYWGGYYYYSDNKIPAGYTWCDVSLTSFTLYINNNIYF